MDKYKKAAVAVVGFVATVVAGLLQAGNVIPAEYTPYVMSALAVLTAFGVYQTPNGRQEAEAAGVPDAGLTTIELIGLLCLVGIVVLVYLALR